MNPDIHIWQLRAWEPSIQSTILTLFWLPIGICVAFFCVRLLFAFLAKQHGRNLRDHMLVIESDPKALAFYRATIAAAVLISLALYLGAIIK